MPTRFQRTARAIALSMFALLVSIALTTDAAEPADGARANQSAASDTGSTVIERSAEQLAAEILRVRQSIGSAWRGDAFEPASPEGVPAEHEVVRTALLAQASSAPSPGDVLPPAPTQKAALREAAYQLDLTAHSLECQELCQQADQVRALAQQIRRQARGESAPGVSPSRQVFPARPGWSNRLTLALLIVSL